MKKLEGEIEDAVMSRARKAGWLVRKLKWPGRVGGPDRYFLKDGRTVLIEFKAEGKEVEPGSVQEREIGRLRAAGGEVHVCNDIDSALAILGIKP